MKKIIPFLLALFCYSHMQAQFLDHLKQKVQQKVNDAVDKTIDNATSHKKKIDTTSSRSPKPGIPSGSSNEPASSGSTSDNDIKSYSKFDFVPGEKLIVEEDFSKTAIGDFPGNWNTKNTAEVVTLNSRPGKWLMLNTTGVFYPDYLPALPENFTMQVQVATNKSISLIGLLSISLLATKTEVDKLSVDGSGSITFPGVRLDLHPGAETYEGDISYSTLALGKVTIPQTNELFHSSGHNLCLISIWRQKQRVRIYVNSTKIMDAPRAFSPGDVLNSLVFATYSPSYQSKDGAFYISDIRIAVGAADTRDKLMKLGKFVTHGILFNVNSDEMLPESYGALKDISFVMQENPALRVRIVGHTDADGDSKLNLDLSKRRALAVKSMLVSTFGIDAARFETEGKGKTQPIDSNSTSVGKANNRRVEFLNL